MGGRLARIRRIAPRYSPAIAAESWVEVQAQLRVVRLALDAEVADDLRRGLDAEGVARIRGAYRAIRAIDAEARRQAAWADETATCADRVEGPGHGRAA